MHMPTLRLTSFRLFFIMVFLCAAAQAQIIAPTPTAPGTEGPPGDAAAACTALATADFTTVPDAPSVVVSATVKEANKTLPRHCLVDGRIAPTIGYQLWLPTSTWNGKYAQSGCGGRCGNLITGFCEEALARGYACLASDLGHTGTFYDNLWAIDNVPGAIDFGFRATHVASITGKAVTTRFYGKTPRYAYFSGASTGGRQALIEAQRFPEDFDGIISGKPAMAVPGISHGELGSRLRAAVNALAGADGKPIISSAEALKLNAAAIARCDMDDNIKDGIISDPDRCDFNPAQMLCKNAKTDDCLTQAQIDAVSAVYAAGLKPGSERAWMGAFLPKQGAKARYAQRYANTYKYPYAWVFDDAANPDLRAYKDRGGKLIIYQGWADDATFPGNPVDYYETVERLMGGRANTQSFFRLFMLPGTAHLPNYGAPEVIDYLSYIEAWVERNQAPDAMLATKVKEPLPAHYEYQATLEPSAVPFGATRPVYPYPVIARYKGKGEPALASSFEAYTPSGPFRRVRK